MNNGEEDPLVACRGWRGHVVVCGLGGVGLRTVEQLHVAGVNVVVVDDDPDPRLIPVVRAWGVPHIVGSSRLIPTLEAVGLNDAAAIVCVQEDDLHTLATALLARRARPDIRVVVLLRNPAVGRAVAGVGIAVLDVAGLSAPSVIEACLQSGSHEIELAGQRFMVVTVTASWPGTLRALYGDLAPLAVVPAEGAEVVVCPGRDHRVGPGDAVTLLGTPDEILPTLAQELPPAEPTAAPTDCLARRLWLAARSFLHGADRRMVLPMAGLLLLVAMSATILRMTFRGDGGPGMTIVDAIYFNIETVTTIGYGDYSFRQQPTWLQIYAIMLMIVGTTLVAVVFAMLTNRLVSRRIEEVLGRRRFTGLYGHIVVIGLGSIGARVAEGLIADHARVVVVDRDPNNRYLARMHDLGISVVVADATAPQTLEAVGLARARAVAVLTSNDLVNMETGLAVRDQLGPRWDGVPVVLRLFDEQLADTVERSFGFGSVRSTAALAAPWFVGAALGLDILATFYVARQPMLVGRITIAAGGGLDGLAMAELPARTRVVAISHADGTGRLEHPPRRGTRFRAGDRAYLIGPYEDLLHVLGRDTPFAKHNGS